MELSLEENVLTAAEFMALRASAGWTASTEAQIAKGLCHSLYTITARVNGESVGMGRLVGDGYLIWYVQDVIVLPSHQSKGVGKAIMEKLLAYAKANSLPGTPVTIGLMAAKGKEAFYENLGFRVRPNEREGAGMVLNLRIPGEGGTPA